MGGYSLSFILEFVWSVISTSDFWAMTIRMTTPVLFAALGSCIASKAGIFNMSIEGLINSTAFISVLADGVVRKLAIGGKKKSDFVDLVGSTYATKEDAELAYEALKASAGTWGWIAGILGGMLFGIVMELVFAYFVIDLKANPSLTGIGANMLIVGLMPFLSLVITGNRANTNTWYDLGYVPVVNIPVIKDIPVISVLLSGHYILTYICVACIFIVNVMMFRTALGLRIRAVGENPNAAESVGVDVRRIQYIANVLCGFFGSMGGTFMSLCYVGFWVRGIAAGRGFIGLAASTLGQGMPIATTIYAYVFGWFDALGINMRALSLFPSQFLSMLPYLATLIGLILYSINTQRKIRKAKAAR